MKAVEEILDEIRRSRGERTIEGKNAAVRHVIALQGEKGLTMRRFELIGHGGVEVGNGAFGDRIRSRSHRGGHPAHGAVNSLSRHSRVPRNPRGSRKRVRLVPAAVRFQKMLGAGKTHAREKTDRASCVIR